MGATKEKIVKHINLAQNYSECFHLSTQCGYLPRPPNPHKETLNWEKVGEKSKFETSSILKVISGLTL